jgi:iron complex transport system permease protein
LTSPAHKFTSACSSKTILVFIILFISLFLLFAVDIIIGSVKIPFSEIWKSIVSDYSLRSEWRIIIMDFRLPRAIVAVITGMALAISGLEMQTYFRNPLAGPYVLGISAGASLGVALLIMGMSLISLPVFASLSQWYTVIAAWAGAGLVMVLILAVSAKINDNTTILILGILFGSITMAFVSILQYFSSDIEVKTFIVWTLGSLGNVTRDQLNIMVPSITAGIILAFLSMKSLNLLLLGEQYAKSMGVNILMSRLLIFVSTSILAGTITAFCGPIGFIGIIVPHIARMIFSSSNHRILLPGTLVLGAVIMVISDIISQVPGSQQILPINSVTAMLGVPVVIWIILRKQRVIRVN